MKASDEDFDELVKNQEALASKTFVQRVAKARITLKQKRVGVLLSELLRRAEITHSTRRRKSGTVLGT